MFKTKHVHEHKIEVVCIEELVAQNHMLRKINEYIDFSFIPEMTRQFYADNVGRPCVDPVVLFKMIFIGYLYGIKSERQLEDEIKHNIAYRWFLGIGIADPVPDHSTISKNRTIRYQGTDVFEKIFVQIVMQAIDYGLVSGEELFTDSTVLKASANEGKYVKEEVAKSTQGYLDELLRDVNKDRLREGKKPLPKNKPEELVKESRISTTDPDSGLYVRGSKVRFFAYLDHRTVDGKLGIITDTFATPGNVHDSVPYIDRLEHQIELFGFNVKKVALDAGYNTAYICHQLRKKDIFAVMPYRSFRPNKQLMSKFRFKYNEENDFYVCPGGEVLNYTTTSRDGYRQYHSDPKKCIDCELLQKCTTSKNHKKVITRHVWEDDKEWVRQNRLSEQGKKFYKKRSEKVERSFANAKQLHGHRYCKYRGLEKVKAQLHLAAACQNMKKIALALWKRNKGNVTALEKLRGFARAIFFCSKSTIAV